MGKAQSTDQQNPSRPNQTSARTFAPQNALAHGKALKGISRAMSSEEASGASELACPGRRRCDASAAGRIIDVASVKDYSIELPL